MADDPRDPTDGTDDELVSAVLDGEASADEVARVRSDPALAARLEEFRRAAAALAAQPPLPAAERRALLDRALDDTADGRDLAPGTPPPGPVAPPGPRRPRRLPPAPLVAAAVIVLVAVGVALILTGQGGDTNRASTKQSSGAATDTGAASRAAPGDASAAGGVGPHGLPETASPTTTAGGAAPPVPYLGTFADGDQLRSALAPLDPAQLQPSSPPPSTAAPAPYTSAQLQRCAQVPRGYEPQLGPPLAYAQADVAGDRVVVISFPLSDQPGKVREIALGQGCTVPILGIDR